MGGAAFHNVVRINKDHIIPTLTDMVRRLGIDTLTIEYVLDNLMGSVLKQETSGDIDIAVDQRFFHRHILETISDKAKNVLGERNVVFRPDMTMIAWPIYNGTGFVQIDFSYGNVDWLKYSHWSAGKYHSAYPGVMIQTCMMLIAKMNKEIELRDASGEVYADIGLIVDVNRGMYRLWRMKLRDEAIPSRVEPDYWESHVRIPDGSKPPRLPRIGYIDDPQEVIRLTLGEGVVHDDINTFEKLWVMVQRKAAEGIIPPVDAIKSRLIDNLMKLPIKSEMTREQMEALPVW